MKLNYIDLFAGCGGLSDGFERCDGFEGLAFVEWEGAPCKTLSKRLAEKWGYKNSKDLVVQYDIQNTQSLIKGGDYDLSGKWNVGLAKLINGKPVSLVIGGPPCQAYSIAGRVRDQNGMSNDYRNYLFESYLKVVDHFRPTAFIFENVEGILSAKPGGVPIIERISDAFKHIGYHIASNLRELALLNSSEFGVPQNRKRVIILGLDCRQFSKSVDFDVILDRFYLEILPGFKSTKSRTVKDAFIGLPPLYPLPEIKRIGGRRISHRKSQEEIPNHYPRFHNLRDQSIFYELAKDKKNGSLLYPNAKALIQLYKDKTGKDSKFYKYHVLDETKPSNTIPAHLYKDGLRHIHPDFKQKRTISPREAARLQSFDDDFVFLGSMGDQYKMIGNAVPPLLAESIAKSVEKLFREFLEDGILYKKVKKERVRQP